MAGYQSTWDIRYKDFTGHSVYVSVCLVCLSVTYMSLAGWLAGWLALLCLCYVRLCLPACLPACLPVTSASPTARCVCPVYLFSCSFSAHLVPVWSILNRTSNLVDLSWEEDSFRFVFWALRTSTLSLHVDNIKSCVLWSTTVYTSNRQWGNYAQMCACGISFNSQLLDIQLQ